MIKFYPSSHTHGSVENGPIVDKGNYRLGDIPLAILPMKCHQELDLSSNRVELFGVDALAAVLTGGWEWMVWRSGGLKLKSM